VAINEAFGAGYEVLLVPTLLSANMTREPTEVRARSLDESPIYWDWSISWSSAGLKTINVSMEIQRRKDGTGQPDSRELWHPPQPLQVQVTEPWFSIKDLRLSALLSGFAGSGLTFPFLYELYKERIKKARSKRKTKPPRG
jgi:hypothetical protein